MAHRGHLRPGVRDRADQRRARRDRVATVGLGNASAATIARIVPP
ncbi:hypothetical protein SCE1572_16495 [Sorangium cellulosum So0157-2]|uniref:Uncharacterized protein n=1 Tax=Sorangium cellulosum So0157-2 TaxID=1254432 RepID=S4XS27_SORCE|nr:hypothetical protein SCE1572_16495 [Sorangium cellulosum So0157-2]